MELDAGLTGNDDILKARQLGVSTYVLARFYYEVTREPGKTAVILTHEPELTNRFRNVILRLHENLPLEIRPLQKYNRAGLFSFLELESEIYIGTVKKGGFGLGMTIHYLLASEYGHKEWGADAEDIWKDLKAAVAPGGWKIRESSAYGLGGPWYIAWAKDKKGEGARPWFFPWWYAKEYRSEIAIPEGHWTKEERALPLDGYQIAWRREQGKDFGPKFAQAYAENDVDCFLAAGNCAFDIATLREMLTKCREPLAVEENGTLRIWQTPDPRKIYVAFSDVASGDLGGDYSATCVLDWETGEQVACIHGHILPEDFARRSASLCATYNGALWGVEDADFGQVVLHQVYGEPIGYENLFWHEPLTGGKEKLGWNTNRRTRPVLIEDLGWALREGMMQVNDPEFIRECLSFVRTEKKPDGEAQPGCFDDLVMAWGGAYQMRKHARREGAPQVVRDRIPMPGGE